jgi:hypothetical protein
MKKYLSILILLSAMVSSCQKSDKNPDEDPDPVVVVDDGIDGDPDIGDLSIAGTFYDKFEGSLDESNWEPLTQVWGQPADVLHQHGGVIKENVYTKSGHAVMRALGDKYTGTLRGAGGQSKRLGGVMKSKKRFASGRYEIKMRVLQNSDKGVLSAAWTFWYKEINNVNAKQRCDHFKS